MREAEQVFALYVQANPFPDPDLLSPTKEEAALSIMEGSPEMDTRERIEVRPTAPVRRWKSAVVAAAAFVVVLGVVGGVLLLTGDGGDAVVLAADANPVVTFDGESFTYEGPNRIAQGRVVFTLVNDSPRDVFLGVWAMYDSTLAAELERTPVGSDMALTPDDPVPQGRLVVELGAAPGEEAATASFYLTPGTLLVDGLTMASDWDYDHVWRAASIEGVAAP